jgi:hypothetical protein
VHFHSCYDPQAFFDAALRNFRLGAAELDLSPETPGFLLFTETAGEDYFRRFQNGTLGTAAAQWRFQKTGERSSLIARRNGNGKVFLIAGRQIATHDGLEVLALGYGGPVAEGLSLPETVDAVLRSGAVAVVPWGFGKWWFRRGVLVRSVVNTAKPGHVFLGDNGGRLRFGRRPKLFELAESRGMFVLPGSDPLPFPSQVSKAGCYGFVLEGELDYERPADGLKKSLRRLDAQPVSYGRREGPLGFVRYQVAMQLRKRSRG